jgi:hypothetical protein
VEKIKRDRDWVRLRIEWAQSGLPLNVWLRRHGIPYATGKRYIRVKLRDEYLRGISTAGTTFEKKLPGLKEKLESGSRAQFLSGLSGILEDIVVESHHGFLDKIAVRSNLRPAELGRLTITAAEQLRAIKNELDGIPQAGERCEWPLLRDFDPHWYQRDFVLDLPSTLAKRGEDVFILAFIAGIGAGKTRCGAEKFGKLCELNRGIPMAVYAPTYRMLEDITKREFIEACARKGIPFQNRPSDDTVILWGDTTIMFRSMDRPDRLRGVEVGAAWIDEPLQMTTREAFDVIAGRVRAPQAKERCILVTGTSDGFGWGYDVLVVEAKKNRVKVYHGATKENTALPPGYYEGLRGLYDAKLALQELEGQWVDVSTGRAYYSFDRTVHVLPEAKVRYNPAVPLILMVDFNVKPMHWVVGHTYPHNGDEISYMIDELYLDQSTSTMEVAEEFVRRYGKHKTGILVYGDATGHHRHTAATRTDYEIINDVFAARRVVNTEQHIGNSNPLQSERVKDVNARFQDARRGIHLYISDRCSQLIQDFERQGFVPGTMQLDKSDPLRGHGSDAVGYYVNREHAIRRMRVKRS